MIEALFEAVFESIKKISWFFFHLQFVPMIYFSIFFYFITSKKRMKTNKNFIRKQWDIWNEIIKIKWEFFFLSLFVWRKKICDCQRKWKFYRKNRSNSIYKFWILKFEFETIELQNYLLYCLSESLTNSTNRIEP